MKRGYNKVIFYYKISILQHTYRFYYLFIVNVSMHNFLYWFRLRTGRASKVSTNKSDLSLLTQTRYTSITSKFWLRSKRKKNEITAVLSASNHPYSWYRKTLWLPVVLGSDCITVSHFFLYNLLPQVKVLSDKDSSACLLRVECWIRKLGWGHAVMVHVCE